MLVTVALVYILLHTMGVFPGVAFAVVAFALIVTISNRDIHLT